jgi:steroid delta-isomerase
MHQKQATIDRYFAAIGRLDREAWVACFAPEDFAHDPADAPARRGPDAHRAFFDAIASLFTELEFRVESTHSCGDRSAVVFSARALAKTGRRAEARGVDVFSFDSQGRILRLDGFWDPSPLFAAAAPAS